VREADAWSLSRPIPHPQVAMAARPRNHLNLQREVACFGRPLRICGGRQHGREIPFQLDSQRALVWDQDDSVDEASERLRGFDPQSRTLEVEFTNGRVYRYFDVPEFLHRGFMVAPSKGAYFNTRIDARFRHEEVP